MLVNSHRPEYDDGCGWWHLSPAPEPRPALAENIRCDYAVVGAGWTGIAAARQLARQAPEAQIALFEAARLGQGAAGRNSGFLFDLPFVFPPDGFRGREVEGRREVDLYRREVADMRRFVEETKVDCAWQEIGQYHVAVDGPGERELATIDAGLSALKEPCRALTRADLVRELGTDYYRAAIHTPGTVQIDPLALLRALAGALPPNVTLYENTPVVRVTPGGQPAVETPNGIAKAGRVLLTTNAFLRRFREVRAPLVPVLTLAGMTRPAGEVGVPVAGSTPWGAVPAALFGTSLRRLPDGRLLVRNTYAYAGAFRGSRTLEARARRRQIRSMQRRFPDFDPAALQWSWGGLVSFFRGANGFFADLAPGVSAAVASGMPVCLAWGRELANHALGHDGPDLAFVRARSNPGKIPPRPLLGVAARGLSAWRQHLARKEI